MTCALNHELNGSSEHEIPTPEIRRKRTRVYGSWKGDDLPNEQFQDNEETIPMKPMNKYEEGNEGTRDVTEYYENGFR